MTKIKTKTGLSMGGKTTPMKTRTSQTKDEKFQTKGIEFKLKVSGWGRYPALREPMKRLFRT